MLEGHASYMIPPEARVQIYEGDQVGPILYGTWERMPWGVGDSCCCVNLDSGQSLHVWLEPETDPPSEADALRPEPLRIVLHAIREPGTADSS